MAPHRFQLHKHDGIEWQIMDLQQIKDHLSLANGFRNVTLNSSTSTNTAQHKSTTAKSTFPVSE
jgi:hypothetical protein